MIVHIVLMQFKDDIPDAAQHIYDLLVALPPKIAEIRTYEVGMNIVESERNDDLSVYSTFDSLDDLQSYQAHPDHQAVLVEIKKVATSIRVVDYEVVS